MIDECGADSRYLDSVESWLRQYHTNSLGGCRFYVEYRGRIDEQILGRAFIALCHQYPVLKARIKDEGGRYLLFIPDDVLPEYKVVKGNYDTLISEADIFVIEATSRLVLVRDGDHGYVLFNTNHAVCDATNLSVWHHDLWELYSRLLSGSDAPSFQARSLPKAPVALYYDRLGIEQPRTVSSSKSSPMARASEKSEALMKPETRFLSRRVVMDKNETQRLVKYARGQGTQLGALLCGKLAVLLPDSDGSQSNQKRLNVKTVVNLRPYVSPPVGPTETTYFESLPITTLVVDRKATATSVARQFKSKISRTISNAAEQLDLLHGDQGTYEIGLNNPGVLPEINNPEGMELIDWSCFVFPPSLHDQMISSVVPSRNPRQIETISWTFNGRLTLWFNGLSTIEYLVDDLIAALRDCS